MKKETKTIAEYKAPKCKCVELQISSSLMQINPSSWGEKNTAGNDLEESEEYTYDF